MDTVVVMKWRRGAKSTGLHGVGGGYVLVTYTHKILWENIDNKLTKVFSACV